MSGVWSYPAVLRGTLLKHSQEVATVVITCIFFAAILWIWSRQRRRFFFVGQNIVLSRALRKVRYGTYTLILYYTTSIINLFMHALRVEVRYGFILFYALISIFELASNIYLLLGAHRILYFNLSRRTKQAGYILLWGNLLVIVLVAVALYCLGSAIANEVIYLQLGTKDMQSELQGRQDEFGVAFYAVQFVLTTTSWLVSSANLLYLLDKEDLYIPSQALSIANALLLFFIRSLTELIIYVKYTMPHETPPAHVPTARAFIFGFTSWLFLLTIGRAAEETTLKDDVSSILSQGREYVRAEILRRLEEGMQRHGQPPSMREVLDRVESNVIETFPHPARALMIGWDDEAKAPILVAQKRYIDSLRSEYGDKVPSESVMY